MFKADLHLHSTYSDGQLTPRELIVHAKDAGLSGLCITDHDTIDAYPDALKIAKEEGMCMGTGAEFSCAFEGFNVHVLAYAFASDGPEINALCARHTERRTARNRAILEKLRKHNIPIEESDLYGHQIGRPHIADALIRKRVVRTHKEAFNRFLAEGKSCYVQGETVSVPETLAIIHKDGGKAFIAHPHLLPKRKKWIERLTDLPFDGLEGHYARFAKDVEQKWISLAEKKGWIVCGGSDFHGSIKPYNHIGSSWVDEETYQKIFYPSKI